MSEDVRVDWALPIEAVHTDGRVVPMIFDCFDGQGVPMTTDAPAGESNSYWEMDGRDYCPRSLWRIRNVAQPAQEPRTAPSGGEVGAAVQKLREAITRALQCTPIINPYRGVIEYDCGDPWAILRDALALVDKGTCAENAPVAPEQFAENAKSPMTLTAEQAEMFRGVLGFVYARQGPFAAEAARCLDLLPEPVDPDEAESRKIALKHSGGNDREYRMCLAAIRRGRALEKEAGR